MDGIVLHGWDETNKVYVKILVDANGNLIINPVNIIDDTPVDGETGKAISSNWAYDHKADASAHHAKYTDAEAVDSFGKRDKTILSGSHYMVDLTDISYLKVNTTSGDATLYSLAGGYAGKLLLINKVSKTGILTIHIGYTGDGFVNEILTSSYKHIVIPSGNTGLFWAIHSGYYWYIMDDYIIRSGLLFDDTPVNNQLLKAPTSNWAYDIGTSYSNHISGQTNTHAQIDSYIADSSPRVRATATGGQSVPSGTPSKVQFNTETWDVHSEYDNTTNYRFTANSNGYYKIDVSFRFATATWNIGTFIFIAIYVNGVQYSIPFWLTVVNTAYDNHMITCFEMVNLSADDYVEIYVYQGDGVAHNLDNSALYNRLLINKLK